MKKVLNTMILLLCMGMLAGCKDTGEIGNHMETTTAEEAGEMNAKTEQAGTKPGESSAGAAKTQQTEAAKVQNRGAVGVKAPDSKNTVQAAYPEMAPYPDENEYIDKRTGELDSEGYSKAFDIWWEQKRSRRNLPEGWADNLNPFFTASIRQFLTEELPGTEGDNRIYSPVNVYMALAMVAEASQGGSRQQILDLLGADSLENLRKQAGQVWNANYSQDGAVTSLLANSLWLDQKVSFDRELLESLAKNYYVSSFWGQMGTKDLDERLQKWLNEQTGGILKEQVSEVHMSDETLMALASAIYFRAKWSNEFSASNTKQEIFHGPKGDIMCDFMHQGGNGTYYWGKNFGAVSRSFQESGGMWLILPDEGVTPEEVLLDDEAAKLFLPGQKHGNQKQLVVNLAMPKFDVMSNIDLKDGLNRLGVIDVFDSSKADFTPLAENMDGIFISRTSHGARVMVDEEGCIAAAYTIMAGAGAAMPPSEEMDFILNRPFIFVVTGDSGLPLFAGIVNKP